MNHYYPATSMAIRVSLLRIHVNLLVCVARQVGGTLVTASISKRILSYAGPWVKEKVWYSYVLSVLSMVSGVMGGEGLSYVEILTD